MLRIPAFKHAIQARRVQTSPGSPNLPLPPGVGGGGGGDVKVDLETFGRNSGLTKWDPRRLGATTSELHRTIQNHHET